MSCVHAYSQESIKLDTIAKISFVDKIIIKTNLDTRTDTYYVNDRSGNTKLKLTTNENLKFSLSLDYEFIGASIGFSSKILPGNNDDNLKGKTSFTDYQFRFFLGNWSQGFLYNKTKGYYVENTDDYVANWVKGEDPYVQLPDLKVVRWKGSTSYVLNPRFSLRNVVYQTEWQLKSAGSFIPRIDYSYNSFVNKINDSNNSENTFDIQLATSYYFTWVIKKHWFISSFLSPALGVRFSKYEGNENGVISNGKSQYLIKTLETGLQIGYSSRKIIFGGNINFNNNWYDDNNVTNILNNKVYAKIYVGYRLDAPKIVQKPFKWINKVLGL